MYKVVASNVIFAMHVFNMLPIAELRTALVGVGIIMKLAGNHYHLDKGNGHCTTCY